MAHFDDLPTELVSLIVKSVYQDRYSFCYKQQLVRCALVNKQFYVATRPLIWAETRIKNRTQADKFLNAIVESPHSVGQHVRLLSHPFPRSDRILLRLMKHLSQLNTLLVFDAKHITDTSIQQLPRYWPDLTFLTLHNALISEQSIQVLAEQYQKLQYLHLYDCPGLTGNIFSALAGSSSSLRRLAIKVATSTRDDWMLATNNNNNNNGDHEEIAAKLVMDAIRLTRLASVRIDGAPICFMQRLLSTLTTTDADAGHRPWPRLAEFSLGGVFDTIGDDQLIPFIQSRPGLLELSFCATKMTDATLEAIARYSPNIEVVGLESSEHISARGVLRLVQRCPQLEQVLVEGCGLFAYQFPEAPPDCLSGRYLVELDQHTIDEIRLLCNSDPGEPDDDDDDDNGIDWDELEERSDFYRYDSPPASIYGTDDFL